MSNGKFGLDFTGDLVDSDGFDGSVGCHYSKRRYFVRPISNCSRSLHVAGVSEDQIQRQPRHAFVGDLVDLDRIIAFAQFQFSSIECWAGDPGSGCRDFVVVETIN